MGTTQKTVTSCNIRNIEFVQGKCTEGTDNQCFSSSTGIYHVLKM